MQWKGREGVSFKESTIPFVHKSLCRLYTFHSHLLTSSPEQFQLILVYNYTQQKEDEKQRSRMQVKYLHRLIFRRRRATRHGNGLDGCKPTKVLSTSCLVLITATANLYTNCKQQRQSIYTRNLSNLRSLSATQPHDEFVVAFVNYCYAIEV